MEDKAHDLHVLLFPWLAHGHISPFLELAKKLSHKGFHAYICSTRVNLSSIKDHLNRKAYPSIQLIEIQLPELPNLPPQCHTTKSLPPHLMPTLKTAFDLSEPSFTSILKALKPDLVIYDFIQQWAPTAASRLNIPAVLFFPTGAASMSFFLHLLMNPHEEFPFPSMYLTESESCGTEHLFVEKSNGIKDIDRIMECMDRSSCFICVKSFKEIESKYINYLSFMAKKEIVPVGPLVHDPPPHHHGQQCKFTEWLDKKARSSSVFVSFGSEYFLSKEEREEIAHGLELSKVNFIWVLRFPEGEQMIVEEALPCGFLERVGKRGMIVEGWAPQARILVHPSIGGFVTHCGWSSVMEGMRFGVPLIALPMHLDQPLNARLVVEVGVGVEIKKGKSGGLEREELERGIKIVLVEKEGEGVRRTAKEMAEKMVKKGDEEIHVVVEKLRRLC
ncbi:beta-D-glucosyl crocetin beta-1,6-glucosyltransferase-like protein [Cinnamomum micranthum f. kanehirae]|uniref:Glycosyltransferase n=1 Tax=Cinnamomum micranthum f. kanehirae TaxID=337451 RepID=A0A3S3R626_9MAGN|nr:beta-D-glucosyl crocetin beta-1,6-glucosyltransferase-like protein [Cinnamomum micranthum f. kanehirae]